MTNKTKEMLSALSSGIDLRKPTFSSLNNEEIRISILQEIRSVKATIVNLINILLEEY